MVIKFREVLRRIYPELAEMPFEGTRMCWYTYTPDSDWIIDSLDSSNSIVVATGGSGHAYKFLPVIGRLVADRIEGKLAPELMEKFSIHRDRGVFRSWGWLDTPRELDLTTLCESSDLAAIYGGRIPEHYLVIIMKRPCELVSSSGR